MHRLKSLIVLLIVEMIIAPTKNRLKAKHEKLESEFGKEQLSDYIAQHQAEVFKSKPKPPVKPALNNGEEVVFRSALTSAAKERWAWIRGDSSQYRHTETGLAVNLSPGGLWQDVFKTKPALMLRQHEETCNAYEVRFWLCMHGTSVPLLAIFLLSTLQVTVHMPMGPGERGEQAGIFYYFDDDNYAKLVVEWTSNASMAVVLAKEVAGSASVSAKKIICEAPVPKDHTPKPVRLRLEVRLRSRNDL